MAEPKQIIAKITDTCQVSDDIRRLTIFAPDIAEHAMPGQFVMVRTADGYDPLLRRPLSIHDVRQGGSLQLLFKVIGKGTRQLATKNIDDEIELLGPLGKGFSVMPGHNKHILIGGGMGIAPLLFLARFINASAPKADMQILLGARTANEIGPVAEEFRKVCKSVSFSTDDGSTGYHGYVTDLLEQAIGAGKAGPGGVIYSCGPHPMLSKVVTLCKKEGLACQVSLETMMACGISACLGCAIKKGKAGVAAAETYLHVCKHGPVFDAAEVAWE